MAPPYQISDWYGGCHICHTATGTTEAWSHMQTAHHDTQLVCALLRYNEPMQFGMQEPRQATVKLVCTADYSSCDIQNLLQQLICPYC